MSADAHGKPMSGVSAHLIAGSWSSANTFRRDHTTYDANLHLKNQIAHGSWLLKVNNT